MTFVVVSGLPGAGKSTIGHALADELRLQFLDKDDFLDELLDCSPNPRAERSMLSRRADVSFIAHAKQASGAVLVSFWRRSELSTTSGTPIEWLAALSDPIELWCRCPAETAVRRFIGRDRHPGHNDDARRSDELLAQFTHLNRLGPLGIGRLVSIDSSRQTDIADLAKRIVDPSADERRTL